MPLYAKAWSVGQKNSFCPCVGWVDLYSHSKCRWLGQFIILFRLLCLCRSLKNNSVILGQDVSPYAQKAPSSWKSTPIHTSSNSNWTSLHTTQMQVAFLRTPRLLNGFKCESKLKITEEGVGALMHSQLFEGFKCESK
jgi:hypothetical protein